MTDELKKTLEVAHTEEGKKAVVAKFSKELEELNNDELDRIAGGRKPCSPGKHINAQNGCSPNE